MINSAGKNYAEVKAGLNLSYWQTGQYSYEIKLDKTKMGWEMNAKPHTKKIYRSTIIGRIIWLDFSSRNLPDMYMNSELEYPKIN